jgi:hypothetical protein
MDIGNLVTITICRSGWFYAHECGTRHGPFKLSELETGWEFLAGPVLNNGSWSAIVKRVPVTEIVDVEAVESATIDNDLLSFLSTPTLFWLWSDCSVYPSHTTDVIERIEYEIENNRDAEAQAIWNRLYKEAGLNE